VSTTVNGLALYVSAPVASFRVPYAREYLETFACVPPSTVFGALLSAVGEAERLRHGGAELALAMIGQPRRSLVLRTTWRIKDRKEPPGTGNNMKPDFQEILTHVKVAIWLRPGAEEARPSLAERVGAALASPKTVERFGALSLGESTHLIDELRLLHPQDADEADFLVPDAQGDLTLPLWPDHVGTAATRWAQVRLERRPLIAVSIDDCWMTVAPR